MINKIIMWQMKLFIIKTNLLWNAWKTLGQAKKCAHIHTHTYWLIDYKSGFLREEAQRCKRYWYGNQEIWGLISLLSLIIWQNWTSHLISWLLFIYLWTERTGILTSKMCWNSQFLWIFLTLSFYPYSYWKK